MHYIKSIFLILLLYSISIKVFAVETDKDSCWAAPDWCVQPTAKWSKFEKDYFIVKYKNVCDARIFIRYCNKKKDGTELCGVDGIRAGRSSTQSTYNATGKYSWRHTGVVNGANDWVCSGKVPNWND